MRWHEKFNITDKDNLQLGETCRNDSANSLLRMPIRKFARSAAYCKAGIIAGLAICFNAIFKSD